MPDLRENALLCTSVWLSLFLLLMVVSSSYQQTVSPTTRRSRSRICALPMLSCKLQRNNQCSTSGRICIRVQTNTDPRKNETCTYICEEPTTGKPVSNTVGNVSVDSFSLRNESNGVNNTFPGEPTTTARTTVGWKSDPAFCASSNLECKNGGRCVKLPNDNTTSLRFKCECPDNYTGTLCTELCAKNCNHGRCIFGEKCECHKGFTGSDCNIVKPEPQTERPKSEIWYIPVIACFVALLVCVLMVYTVQKLRWRSLLVTKLFYYFQPYEDEDGKEFDAFISFRATNKDYTQSEDEKFVLRVLQPMLEKQCQYKVCVHYRDFPPGETIANNIMWAVENSRRTILILSPLYVESEWARLEYQKAQQEMLQLRHKIIPVIFSDISDTHIEDPTLKHILSSVTYINYPSESDEGEHSKFWQMLQLALPKKRSFETETSSTFSHPPLALSSSQTLMSQESWQSGRTDVTNVSEDIEMDEVKCDDCVTLDVNELDMVRVKNVTIDDTNKKQLTLNNNADKFISILEKVS